MVIIESNRIIVPVHFNIRRSHIHILRNKIAHDPGRYIIGFWNRLLGNFHLKKTIIITKVENWKKSI